MVPHHTGDDDAHAFSQYSFGYWAKRSSDNDDGRRGAGGRVVRKIADAPCDQCPDGDLSVWVDCLHRLLHPGAKSGVRQWNVERDTTGRGAKPNQMLLKEEEFPVICPERLIHSISIEESVVED